MELIRGVKKMIGKIHPRECPSLLKISCSPTKEDNKRKKGCFDYGETGYFVEDCPNKPKLMDNKKGRTPSGVVVK
jgi:hypothetical protein